jgi:hypothetical protein
MENTPVIRGHRLSFIANVMKNAVNGNDDGAFAQGHEGSWYSDSPQSQSGISDHSRWRACLGIGALARVQDDSDWLDVTITRIDK